MAEEKEVIMKYGVKKDKIEARIDRYTKLLNEEAGIQAISGLNVLTIQLGDLLKDIEEAENDPASSPDVLKELYDLRDKYEKELAEKSESDYVKASDVIVEVDNLINNSKDEYSFVEIEYIEERIEYYKNEIKKAENRITYTGFLNPIMKNEALLLNTGVENPTQSFIALVVK